MSDCTSPGLDSGPLSIDYQFYFDCTLESSPFFRAVFIAALLGWIVVLIHLLGNTAGNYLSPTLGKICERLHLSYNVAGVTFLAFGNGAPDVFSSITSFLGGEDAPMIGINALLGGSMYVCTVVVGSIAILCPCDLSANVFLRDVSFHIMAVTAVSTIAAKQTLTLPMAASLFVLYFLYVVTVLGCAWYDQKKNMKLNAGKALVSTSSIPGSAPIPDEALGKSLQTAFWHQPAPKKTDASSSTSSAASASISSSASVAKSSDGSASAASSAESVGYTFLILDEHGEDTIDAEDATITLSGGLISPAFSGTIIEDYFGTGEDLTSTPSPLSLSPLSPWEGMAMAMGNSSTNSSSRYGHRFFPLSQSFTRSPLTDRLLPRDESEVEMEMGPIVSGGEDGSAGAGEYGGGSGRAAGTHHHRSGRPSFGSFSEMLGFQRPSKPVDSYLSGLYWQQWLLQRRIRKNVLSSEFWNEASLTNKILTVLEYPTIFIRDISIPTLQPESWSKVYAVMHPFASPIVLLVAFGDINKRVGELPVTIFVFFMALLPSVAVFLLSHHSRPPNGRLAGALWVLTAFIMCVTWIYLLASELVVCLETMGEILGIPSAYLGLTVLAWGNSIGDFFSNTALARRGLGEMAIAGCYGGPVFNILVGLGLSICYACVQTYPEPFVIRLDTSSIVSLVFLYVTLCSTALTVSMCNYRLERGMGYFLILLYVIYSLVQAGVVLGQA